MSNERSTEITSRTGPWAEGPRPEPGTYCLVFRSLGDAVVQIGRLGVIRLRPGWYVYAGSALREKTGVLRRVARHADLARPRRWNVDFAKPHLELLEVWFTHDPRRLECTWSAAVGSLPGAEVHLRKMGGNDCKAGCPAHFYYFPARPSLAAFREKLTALVPDHAGVASIEESTPEALAERLASLVRSLRIDPARRTK